MIAALLAALLAAHLAATPHPRSTEIDSPSIAVVVFTAHELRHRGFHAAIAVGPQGDIAGAILRRNGDVACALHGDVDAAGCVTIGGAGCWERRRACP